MIYSGGCSRAAGGALDVALLGIRRQAVASGRAPF